MTRPSLANPEVIRQAREKQGRKHKLHWSDKDHDARQYWYPLTPADEDDELVYSVTTALKMINKPALPQWYSDAVAARVTANPDGLFTRTQEEGFRWLRFAGSSVLKDLGEVGDRIHKYAESDLDWSVPAPDVVDERDAQLREQWHAFRSWHEVEPLHLEVTAWNHTHGYAGTLDGLLYIDGVLTLADIKSSRNTWSEHKEQLAALGNCEELLKQVGPHEWERLNMPPFEQYALIRLRPNDLDVPAYWELLTFPKEEINDYFDTFLGALMVKKGRELTKKYDSK